MAATHNPTANGQCNWSNRVKATWKTFPANLGALLDMRVISTPNGQTYGVPGYVPCDHVLHMQYELGHATFDGQHRVERLA